MKKIFLFIWLIGISCFGKSIMYTYIEEPSLYKLGGYIKLNDDKEKFRNRIELEKFIEEYKNLVQKGICLNNKDSFKIYIENNIDDKCSIYSFLKNKYILDNNEEELKDIERTKEWKIEDKGKITVYRIIQLKEINGYSFGVIEKAY